MGVPERIGALSIFSELKKYLVMSGFEFIQVVILTVEVNTTRPFVIV